MSIKENFVIFIYEIWNPVSYVNALSLRKFCRMNKYQVSIKSLSVLANPKFKK